MADNYLITGYWGEPHVTAENDRGINAAIFGPGKFVLPVGEMFRAEYIGNNTVRIYDGKLLDNGAAAGIPAGKYVDLLIPEAGQGMNRNDLIIFQYSQDASTLIESGVFRVLPGAEVSGTAIDPLLQEEDLLTDEATFDQIALWRVPVSGANISEPVRLFRVSKRMSDIEANNLLVNSDFTNPVNHTGFTGGAPIADNVYIIDKWKTQQNASRNIVVNFSVSGLTIQVSTGLAGIAQKIPTPKNDVTFAAKVNGKIVFVHAAHGVDSSVKTDDNVLLYVEWLADELQVIIRNTGDEANTYTIEWAALYDGEYAERTLPAFLPRAYPVEVAACGPVHRVWENANPTSTFASRSLSLDLSGYKGIFVTFKAKTSANAFTSSGLITVGDGNNYSTYFISDSGPVWKRACRADLQGVYFADAGQSGQVDNTLMIPATIYGVT